MAANHGHYLRSKYYSYYTIGHRAAMENGLKPKLGFFVAQFLYITDFDNSYFWMYVLLTKPNLTVIYTFLQNKLGCYQKNIWGYNASARPFSKYWPRKMPQKAKLKQFSFFL